MSRAEPHVVLDGRVLPAAEAAIPIDDRSFLYGDGLFETALIRDGFPVFWEEHLLRLRKGAGLLGFPDVDLGPILPAARHLARLNGHLSGVLKVHLSRGSGPRGYSPSGARKPRLLVATSALPDSAREPKPLSVTIARHPLFSGDPLGPIKSANKLGHILARAEAERGGFCDAILLNELGQAVEGTSANLIVCLGGALVTPPLASGCLEGVTRGVLLKRGVHHGAALAEATLTAEELRKAEGLAFCSSVAGVAPITQFEGRPLGGMALFAPLRAAWEALVASNLASQAAHT